MNQTSAYGKFNTSLTKATRAGTELTKKIETVTSKIPPIGYLSLAIGSMALSASIAAFTKKKTMANFIGLWVPSFLLFGVYNKLVNMENHEPMTPTESAFH